MRKLKKTMVILLFIISLLGIVVFTFLQQPQFGKSPSGERLQKIRTSSNYRDDIFVNQIETPAFSTDEGIGSMIWERLFEKNKHATPIHNIPSVKTDLLELSSEDDILVWFGHSSIYMQIEGKKILIDPVLSGSASPLSFAVRSYEGSDVYTVDDIPDIDYLFITHDHFDHLDYKTIVALKSRIKQVICGLGVGEHLEYWGFKKDKIIERDWNESLELHDNFKIYFTPARHFSGRSLKRNNTLWTSFVLQTSSLKIFIGGDSGYGTHFEKIGKDFGEFDLVILENGQYNEKWPYVHMTPEETLKAAKDLNAKKVFPVHSSKFTLANHAWDEPLKQIVELNDRSYNLSLITPMIGESVNIKDLSQIFSHWWTDKNRE